MQNRIKGLRKNLGLTQVELGKKVGVTGATINKYETGLTVNIKRSMIVKLAQALDTTPGYLMGWENSDVSGFPRVEPLPIFKRVPIIGEIACGEPILAEENYDGEAGVDERIKADFALRCKGDSMINARIFDGDLVFIKAQEDVENGEIAAVIIEDEATLKRVYKYKERVELRPENPLYPVLNYEGEELLTLRIIGKAVAFTSTVR